ncbi:hypothetical protein [Haloferula rosea]|uniref:Uncharacterized protein n=1 Tax=Haloferula rosea TaxID=490093 RepID=A0A934VEZ8_9BACT|nr:hypothetical protein [Haloferula rosea]MBK1826457.1 hypothetical protein [Haloferula rosea]
MVRFREDRRSDFYLAALAYAQSLWVGRKPAQAILQLNKAWSADLIGDEVALTQFPAPYRALVWMLGRDLDGAFLGNPVRHFQHLATRMSGARSEVRSWRAWACFHLGETILDPDLFPRDLRQIEMEDLVIPSVPRVIEALALRGWPDEAALVEDLLRSMRNS